MRSFTIEGWLPEQIANGPHSHWTVKRKKLQAAQVMVWASARHAGLRPVQGRAKLTLTYIFPVKRRRDQDNLYARSKGVIDGLVQGKWIQDDSTEWLELSVRAEVERGRKATCIELGEV